MCRVPLRGGKMKIDDLGLRWHEVALAVFFVLGGLAFTLALWIGLAIRMCRWIAGV